MTQLIHAIYEAGVFRPLEPVFVSEHELVLLTVQSEIELLQRQRDSLMKLRTAMDSLPSGAPTDGLGGTDYDQILYGWKK